jgi:hypothetical protein
MHSGLHPPTQVTSATRSHTSSGRAATTLFGDRRQPGHLAGDLAAVGAQELGHVFIHVC